MAPEDESSPHAGGPSTPPPAPVPTPTAPWRRHLGLKVIGIVVVVPALLFAAWTEIALHWTYSQGDRAGYVQKFSRKGWLCKTWEGELAMVNIPGSAPTIFPFTVKRDSLSALLTSTMGTQVTLHYDEHRGVIGSCFGDTQYYVTGVRPVGTPPAGTTGTAGGPMAPGASAAPAPGPSTAGPASPPGSATPR